LFLPVRVVTRNRIRSFDGAASDGRTDKQIQQLAALTLVLSDGTSSRGRSIISR
jgi:hypothetical protein